MSLVVKKTLEQIGVQTVEATGSPRGRRGRTSLGKKREDIKKQRTMIGDADKEWKVRVQNLSWNPF